MCVGIKIEDPLNRSQNGINERKQSTNDERKEKAKDAARTRRMLESDYFEELEKLLPITEPPPSSQQAGLDKTSIIRLNIAQLKIQDVLQNGIQLSNVKEEIVPNVDLFSCLDGFSLVLGSGGDVIYVSENVCRYIGLTQVELLGQQFSEFVHPCDHNQLELLIPRRIGSTDELVEIFVRVKCTMTERGRMVNLKQASYKPLKMSGKARQMPENEVGGVTGTVFLGLARCIVEREVMVDNQIGFFTTKHSVDMKFMDTDQWMSSIAGYKSPKLYGFSFYDLVHAQDIWNVQKAFKNLVELGQCETPLYRLLCHGGGYVWLQTKAYLTIARRGTNKGQNILCRHQQISEVLNREEVLSTVQMKNKTHLAPSLTEDSPSSIANTNMNETRTEKKFIIIKPQQNPNSNPQMITSLTGNKIDNTPTSVKTSHPQSQYTSVPVIQNSRSTVQKKEVLDLVGKADSQETSRGPTDLNTTTQSIFNTCETTQGSHTTSDLLEELLPIINLNEGHELESKENAFLEDILDDMERRSPHSGDQCVSIESKDSEKESFDNIQMLNFDDNFDVDAKEFFKPIEKLTFDDTQVLIDPNKNTSWGSRRQSVNPYDIDHLHHNRGVLGHAVHSVGPRKRSQSDVTSKGYPDYIQSDSGILMDQKHRLWRNPLENSVEPPRDKIILWAKIEKEFSEEQESYHGAFEDGSFNKRLKLNPESTSGNSVINSMENTNMNHNLYNIVKPDFDAKFGTSFDIGKMIQTYHDYQELYK